MNLIYFHDPQGNFGDDLNSWIWDSLLPGWQGWDEGVSLLGVGTLINAERLDPLRDSKLLIAGSGVGYGTLPSLPLPPEWDVRSVRGPKSADLLGLPQDLGLLDPAIMIPEMEEFTGLRAVGPPVFIPHHKSVLRHDWAAACRTAGLTFVSPRDNSKDVIRKIAAAPLVLAESMHAAILADSFRVPWIAVSISHWFNAAKWGDWAESLDLDLKITPMFPELDHVSQFIRKRGFRKSVGQAKSAGPALSAAPNRNSIRQRIETAILPRRLRAIAHQTPSLSDASLLAAKKAKYGNLLASIRSDYARS